MPNPNPRKKILWKYVLGLVCLEQCCKGGACLAHGTMIQFYQMSMYNIHTHIHRALIASPSSGVTLQ